jgi:CheY-like chemotaxis protein
VNLLILVVDDEPDVELLFRQQFRRDLRAGRFTMDFAQSADMALTRIADAGEQSLILILSDINMPGMSGLELLPKAKAIRPDVPIIMITPMAMLKPSAGRLRAAPTRLRERNPVLSKDKTRIWLARIIKPLADAPLSASRAGLQS